MEKDKVIIDPMLAVQLVFDAIDKDKDKEYTDFRELTFSPQFSFKSISKSEFLNNNKMYSVRSQMLMDSKIDDADNNEKDAAVNLLNNYVGETAVFLLSVVNGSVANVSKQIIWDLENGYESDIQLVVTHAGTYALREGKGIPTYIGRIGDIHVTDLTKVTKIQ